MAVETLTRSGLLRWSQGSDPSLRRSDMNYLNELVDGSMAFDVQGPAASRPAPGVRGRWFTATDTGQLWREDGDEWAELPTFANGGTYLSPIGVRSNAVPQFRLENNDLGADVSLLLTRRTNAAGDENRYGRLRASANRIVLEADSTPASGFVSNLAGRDGRWALNQPTDVAPPELLVLYSRSGPEVARFTEGGLVGLGRDPAYRLDVASSGVGIPALRLSQVGAEYSASITPDGPAVFALSSGGEYTGGAFVARATSGTFYRQVNGAHFWHGNSATLTPGTSYSLSQRMVLTAEGVLLLPSSGGRLGIGVTPAAANVIHAVGNAPVVQGDNSAWRFWDASGVDRGSVGLRLDLSSSATDLVLSSSGGAWRFWGPTENVRILYNGAGVYVRGAGRFGLGSMQDTTGTGPYIELGDLGYGDQAILRTRRPNGAYAHMILQAEGAGAQVRVLPEGYEAARFSRRSNGVMMGGFPGWAVLGSADPNFITPGIRVQRWQRDIPASPLSGQMAIPHGLGIDAPQRIMLVSAWYRGNSGEAAHLPVLSVDGGNVYVNVPSGMATRTMFFGAVVADHPLEFWR